MTRRALVLIVDHLTAALVARIDRLKAWLIERNAKAVRAHVQHSSAQSTKGKP
jgi:hypothetical protein